MVQMDLYLKLTLELILLQLLHLIYENMLNDEIKKYVDQYDHMEYLVHDVDHVNLTDKKKKFNLTKKILFINLP